MRKRFEPRMRTHLTLSHFCVRVSMCYRVFHDVHRFSYTGSTADEGVRAKREWKELESWHNAHPLSSDLTVGEIVKESNPRHASARTRLLSRLQALR